MTNSFPKRPFIRDRKYDRNYNDRGPRRNERIRVPEIRVIGPDGTQLGIMKTAVALAKAKAVGLDLVEISANSNPPVCRILDYGKYKYEEDKKSKGQQKSNGLKIKEVKFHPNVDVGDFETKVRRCRTFLDSGYKVKLSLLFRGREMAYQDLGFQIMHKAINSLQESGTLDAPAKMAGRMISATVSPLAATKNRRPKEVNAAIQAKESMRNPAEN